MDPADDELDETPLPPPKRKKISKSNVKISSFVSISEFLYKIMLDLVESLVCYLSSIGDFYFLFYVGTNMDDRLITWRTMWRKFIYLNVRRKQKTTKIGCLLLPSLPVILRTKLKIPSLKNWGIHILVLHFSASGFFGSVSFWSLFSCLFLLSSFTTCNSLFCIWTVIRQAMD